MESSRVHNANARRSPVLSDTTCPRPNMPTSEGLPQRWRLRTKKLAKIRVRFLRNEVERKQSQRNWRRIQALLQPSINGKKWSWYHLTQRMARQGAKTIKKNTNSTQNKSQTHCAKQYKVTSFLSTDCELSSETCSKNVYSPGPRSWT